VRAAHTHYNESIQCAATTRHKMHKRSPEFLSLLCILVARGDVFAGSRTVLTTKAQRHKEGSAIHLFNRQDARERVARTHYTEPIQCAATTRHKMHKRSPEFLSRLCLLVATEDVFAGSGTGFHTKVRRHKERLRYTSVQPPGRQRERVARTHYNESIQCGATRRHKMHKRSPEFLSRLCLLVATGNVFAGSRTGFHHQGTEA
jgi:hypothetical protein